PPAHVIFILATTEEEKLLETILSRCQVFRFRSPSRAVLAEIVTDVAKKEGFTLTLDAADLIAIAADGSFRDALGVTQKVLLASGDKVGSADEVATIIGAPKNEIMLSLIKALHNSDTKAVLEAIAQAVALHVDMKLFTRLLLDNIRAVMLLRHQPDQAADLLVNFGEAAKEVLGDLAKQKTSPLNSQMLLKLIEAAQQVNYCSIPQLPLEIVLIDLTTKK
ncbi:MAG TPA: hypothetical protein PKD95_02130, partial [Candidatus Paceibacterota bacterium]|nr:hypothetical protein [Candidatus Paceibacterota bacterium]